MKITLDEITNAVPSIKKLATFDFGTPKLNYKFINVVDAAEKESKKLIELRKRIIEKYRDHDKDEIFIPVDKIEEFNKEMNDAGALEIEIAWESIDMLVDSLSGFTAIDMKCIDGKFINIKENEYGN